MTSPSRASGSPAEASLRATAAVLRGEAERSRQRAVVIATGLGAVAVVLGVVASVTPPPALSVAVDAGTLDGGAVTVDAGAVACADVASCDALCRAEPTRVEACVRAADAVRTGRGIVRDLADARVRYRATCRATGDPAACTRLALLVGLLEDRAGAADWLDPREAPAGLLATACQGGAERGRLACAAIELLDLAVDERAVMRAQVAACPLADAAACAAAIARSACEADELPEACYLAALAPSTAPWARATLEQGCQDRRDPSTCQYAWRATGNGDDLLIACSDIGEPSVARACLDRARDKPRTSKAYVSRACALGACEAVSDIRTLRSACDAGHLSGCANLLARPQVARAQRDAALARAAALAPEVELTAPPLAPVAAYQACRYGAASACDAVVTALPATDPLRAELEAYARRLRAPLTP